MPTVNLFVGGARTAIDEAEAKTHIERFEGQVEGGKDVLKFDISCRAWSKESFAVIEPFMKKHAGTVRYLDLADIIASRPTDEGLEITEGVAKAFESSDLIEVDLSDNAMGPRGLIRVESLFTNSNLQRLYLSNCGLSHASMEMLNASIMADGGRIANSLTELVLDRNMLGVDGALEVGKFLPHCKKLSYFSYNGCRPISEGTKHICEGLAGLAKACTPVLRRLDLEDCSFEGDGTIEFLCDVLKVSGQFQHLNLNDGDVGVEGLEKIVAAFTESKANLTHLYIDGNGELGSDGARILADFLQTQMGSLVCLHASINEFGDEGVSILLEPFSACRNVLRELTLNQNEIEEEGSKALVSAKFPKLTRLSLEDNDDIKKKYIKAKYGSIVSFGEEDEDDEDEDDDALDALVSQMKAAKI